MIKPTFASLFTGGGLADCGAIAARCQPIWGVEYVPQLAEMASTNLSHDVSCQSILDCDPMRFDRPDILWASPPCPSFSTAKTNAQETEDDIALAQKVADFIAVLQPPVFILENVQGYAKSKSLKLIENKLYELGYWIDRQVLNSADYGVPQTRKRLILRAVKEAWVPSLPPTQKWRGWYEAIEDLIPSLPESEFADWQLERMPDLIKRAWIYAESSDLVGVSAEGYLVESKYRDRNGCIAKRSDYPSPTVTKMDPLFKAFLVEVQNTIRDNTTRSFDEPSFTITANSMRRPASTPRAFLVNESSTMEVRIAEEPAAAQVKSDRNLKQKAWLSQGRVVAMTPRALGRFQTLPDWYELPENKWATVAIGNGVPCLLSQQVIESLISCIA